MISGSVQSQGRGRPDALCEEALSWLDNAGSKAHIDDRLLSVESATAMRRAIRMTMTLITSLDLGKMLARQRWLDRLTGADVEARLHFELAARQINLGFDNLEKAAKQSGVLLTAMAMERQRIAEEQQALAEAIGYGESLKGFRTHADSFLVDRFDRRLANLAAMQVANAMAIEQFRLTENNLKALLDRYTDIATVVVPLWQQHLFALLHAPGRLREADADVANFIICQSALEEYFTGESR